MKAQRHQPAIFLFLVVYVLGLSGLLFLPTDVVWKTVAVLLSVIPAYFLLVFGLKVHAGKRDQATDVVHHQVGAASDSSNMEELSAQDELSEVPLLEAPLESEPVRELGVSPFVEETAVEAVRFLEEIEMRLRHPESNDSTLQDIKTSSEFIKENVFRSFDIADNLASTAKQAFDLSEQVQSGIKVVTDALSESLKQTNVLFEHSKKIALILEIMSEVSEKIHILSINASIVSARAGALGRGFDVVAKEIRSLAKETELSLHDIEAVIAQLQRTIGTVIKVVRAADAETENEKNSLMAVAGSLQGVILGVEIIRAVSSVAKDKSEEQTKFIVKLLDQSGGPSNNDSAIDRIAELKGRLQALKVKE